MDWKTNIPLGIAHELPEIVEGRAYFEVAVMPTRSSVIPAGTFTPMTETYESLGFRLHGNTLTVDPTIFPKGWEYFIESPRRWTPFEDVHKISKRRFWKIRKLLHGLLAGAVPPSVVEDELRPFVQSRANGED
jgi:hypothetical protein